tara:strand:+ start:185 stop:1420 length:1236 start_codon:yes stop_codon:yes gene_type:complete
MDQKIDIPNENYNFDNITLSTPISVYGGAYFTKLTNEGNDIFIQTPMCGTKNGVVKSGKRMFIDLLFDKTDEKIVIWFENLEEKSRNLIFDKKDDWFQDSIEMDDIESAFSPSVRLYKSGNYYLIRVFLDNPRMYGGSNSISIYDDREKELSIEDITSESKIICILQIHGIKFTSKSFQIYSQVKQVMIIKNSIFNKCCIKTGNKNDIQDKYLDNSSSNVEVDIVNNNQQESVDDINVDNNEREQAVVLYNNKEKEESNEENIIVETEPKSILQDIEESQEDKDNILKEDVENYNNNNENNEEENINLEFEDLTPTNKINSFKGLEEFDMELNLDESDSITLRKSNDVYYDMYKKVREKAKEARKNALQCYIEAQNIKNTHNLVLSDDSSDDEYEKQLYLNDDNKNVNENI